MPLAVLPACGWHGMTTLDDMPLVEDPAAGLIENPMFVQAADREFLWNQLVDATDDHFRIEREERVRELGGVLTEGRIDTYPTVGSTLLEPWRRDSTRGFEKLHATLQTVRRRAEVRATPTEGGYLVGVTVLKELEDVDRPEHATAGQAGLRHDGSLTSGRPAKYGAPNTLGWIALGRDVSLEQKMLQDVRARLFDPAR